MEVTYFYVFLDPFLNIFQVFQVPPGHIPGFPGIPAQRLAEVAAEVILRLEITTMISSQDRRILGIFFPWKMGEPPGGLDFELWSFEQVIWSKTCSQVFQELGITQNGWTWLILWEGIHYSCTKKKWLSKKTWGFCSLKRHVFGSQECFLARIHIFLEPGTTSITV